MTSRLRIEHSSTYTYDAPVTASYNEVRLTPLVTAWQIPLDSALRVPDSTWQQSYVDYWGTPVRVIEAQQSHLDLVIDATSLVEVDASRVPEPNRDAPWDLVRSARVEDRYGEFLGQTPSTEPDPELAALADDLAATRAPHDVALTLAGTIHDAMSYRPGSTGVHTAAAEAWTARSGVCQDYAHLLVGALRQVGLPARYVSGYLHPDAEPRLGVAAPGESHAWVEWWLDGWTGFDPTNNIPIGERHVVVGRGRDYTDVPPIKGIVAGTASSKLDVRVEITRLA